jgi:hypothetical protein
MSAIAAIEGQNHFSPLSSQRNLVANEIATAQNHAARPFPGLPKYINTSRIGDVISNDAMAQDKVTLLSDCSVISALPNILNILGERLFHPKARSQWRPLAQQQE